MARDWTVSQRGGVAVATWMERIEAWKKRWEALFRERRPFRDAIDLKLPQLMPITTTGITPGDNQVDIYWFARAHDLYMAQLYDPSPEARRDADGSGEGDFADFEEVLLARAAAESQLAQQFRPAITDLMWAGHSFVWLGIDVLPSLEATQASAQGAGDITEAVLQGTHAPHPIQDHEAVGTALETVADSPDTGAQLTDEQHLALLAAAAEHHVMEAEQDAQPVVWTKDRGTAWAKWLPPGWTMWDPLVLDVRHSRWIARKVVLPIQTIRGMEILRPAWRKAIKPTCAYDENESAEAKAGGDQGAESEEEGQGVLIEVWDAVNRTRHYLSDQSDEYGEKDETYPYLTERGDVGIPGFFPCVPVVGQHGPTPEPDRAFGLPRLAAGWPQQEEIVKIRSKMIAAAKRTNRLILRHPRLSMAQSAAIVNADDMDSVTALDHTDVPLDQQVFSPEIHEVPRDWAKEIQLLERDFYNNVGISPAQMTLEGSSDTATEAGIIQQSAQAQVSDLGTRIEECYAHALTILRSLIRLGYRPEKVADLVGAKWTMPVPPTPDNPEGSPLYDRWKAQSTDGDEIRVRLASRARDEDPVRVQALERAIMALGTATDEMGIPLFSPRTKVRLYREMFRALNVGDVEEMSPEEKAAFVQAQALRTMMGGGEQPGGGPGPNEPKAPGSSKPGQGSMRGNAQGAPRQVPGRPQPVGA